MPKKAITIRVDESILTRIDALRKFATTDGYTTTAINQTRIFETGARKELDILEKKYGVKKEGD